MALNKDRLGDNITDALEAEFSETLTPASDTLMRKYWKIVADEIIKEIKQHGDIKLLLGDIPILPGTFKDSTMTTITGVGENDAVTLEQKIE